MKEVILQIRDKNKVEGQAEFFEEKRFDIPETFEELKELCKGLKGLRISEYWIELSGNNRQTLVFGKDGTILEPNNIKNIAENRSPQQMWNIIKNL